MLPQQLQWPKCRLQAQDAEAVQSTSRFHCGCAAFVFSRGAFSGAKARCVCAGEAGRDNTELCICHVHPPADSGGPGTSQEVSHCRLSALQVLGANPVPLSEFTFKAGLSRLRLWFGPSRSVSAIIAEMSSCVVQSYLISFFWAPSAKSTCCVSPAQCQK
jgi:hypothetical protein